MFPEKIQFLFITPFILVCSSIQAQIPTTNMVAHYTFNNTLNDAGTNNYHIINASGNYTTDRLGIPNNAFMLNGINDSLILPVNEFSPIMGDFTISLWYKTNSPNIMNLFSLKGSAIDSTNNFEIQLNSHNNFYIQNLPSVWYQTYMYWNGSAGDNNAVAEGSAGNFTKGEWCHFLVTRKDDTISVYREHQLYTNSINNFNNDVWGSIEHLILGAAPYKFKGAVDDIRLYNRALNANEIKALWHENKPIIFTFPKPNDAFVLGSHPLIYWEYDDYTLSDSIDVRYRINNGSWNNWPHSNMAYENGFYYTTNHSAGTKIEIKVNDRLDTNLQATASFIMSEYDWMEVNNSLPFTARDGAGLVSFNNKMYLLGGWDPPFHPPNNTHSEVWSSTDGDNWIQEPIAPWPARHCAAWLVHDSAMWVIGGDPQSGYVRDVWKTNDGINWVEVVNAIPGYTQRMNVNYAVLNNQILLSGGESIGHVGLNDVWQSNDGLNWTQLSNAHWVGRGMQINSCVDDSGNVWMLGGSNEHDRRSYNDIWKTNDGTNWTLVDDAAPWTGRYWHTVGWFDNKIWVIAGVATGTEMNDVWYSSDGITWYELKTTTGNWPLGTRHAQSTTVFDNAIWYMCGISTNSSWKIINTQSTIGINENLQNDEISLYPNPTSNYITLQLKNEVIIGQHTITDEMGRIIYHGYSNNSVLMLNVQNYTPGLYLIHLNQLNKTYKFIKS